MSTPDRETPQRFTQWCTTSHGHQLQRDDNGSWVLLEAHRRVVAEQAERIATLTTELAEAHAMLTGKGDMSWVAMHPDGPTTELGKALATLTAQVDRQTRQLADCHGVIASLWATTNPDEATPDLVTDIEHILGFKSGDCQNSVCGQLLMAEQQVEQQAQEIADLRRAIWPTPEAWATARDFVLLAGAHREDSETVDRFEQSDDYGVHGGYAEAAIERAKQAQEITRLREALKALIMDADLLCDGFSGGAFDQCRRTLAKAKEALK